MSWIAAGAVYAVASLAATIADRNLWPICSYNMFNDSFDEGMAELVIDLSTPTGWSTGHTPASVYPVPFFRATEVLEHILVSGENNDEKTIFSHRLMRRLNRGGWRALDEVRRSADVERPVLGIRVRVLEHTREASVKEHRVFEHECTPVCVADA